VIFNLQLAKAGGPRLASPAGFEPDAAQIQMQSAGTGQGRHSRLVWVAAEA
jgi:hypothetical protein